MQQAEPSYARMPQPDVQQPVQEAPVVAVPVALVRPHRRSGTLVVVLGAVVLVGGATLALVALVRSLAEAVCEDNAHEDNGKECADSASVLWYIANALIVLGIVVTALGVRRCTRKQYVALQPPV